MARDLAQESHKAEAGHRTADWGSVRAGIVSIILVISVWIVIHTTLLMRINFLIGCLILASLHSFLVVSINRSFRSLGFSMVWQYRMAFFLGTALGVGCLILEMIYHKEFNFEHLLLGFAVWVGSFGGALISTGLEEGLTENNSPPSQAIQEHVLQLHQQRIGQGDPIDPWKRLFDILVASTGIILSAPFWLVCIFLIWIENPGPILFVKNSVTRGGRNFRQYKFRTMVLSAEEVTGPVLAKKQDERILLFGSILRKTALDELPQLLNIMRGEMSFVGPRPQRTVLVADYLHAIPEYAERHRVLPGLSGLAQVAGDYYLTPRQKNRFDRLYIQHANLTLDLKLIGLAVLITFWYRWQPAWNGRLPRRFLHPRKPHT